MRNSILLTAVALLLLSGGALPGAANAQTTAARPASQPGAAGGAQPKPATPAPLDINVKAENRAIDESVPADAAVEAAIAPYSGKVRELEKPIGKLEGDLKRGGMGGGSLGNFVADALRDRAQAKLGKPVLLAVINSSGLRKSSIPAGDVSTSDIFQLLPFENALVAVDLTGEQLRRFMDVTVARRNAQAGARIVYRNNPEKKQGEIVSVKLGSLGQERDIDPQAVYTIVTIDYLVKRGGDYSVLQEGKNVRELGLTMRDAVLDYVKAETAAGRPVKAEFDGRFSPEKATATTKTEGEEPQ